MKKTTLRTCLFMTFCVLSNQAFAQSKIKDGSITGTSSLPNVNAILELESSRRGLLMPRIALQGTTFAAPLTAHIAGMVVYNTATVNDVTPGYYYNDGTTWRKMAYTSPSVGGGGNDLSNGNGILVINGTGATLKATTLRLDSTAVAKMMSQSPVKDSVAVVMSQSPVKDSINTVVVNSIASGAITGQNLSNGNGILVTNGTGATLKAASLRLDSTVVAKMMNQSPVKDSVAVVMTQSPVKDSINTVVVNSIASGAITGQNLSNGNGILVTNGTGATLKSTTLRLDSTAVAKMMSQSPVKDSVAVVMTQSPVKDSINTVVVNSIASGAITGQNLSNGNGILVSNGTGATLKATSLRLDSTAVAKMMSQSPVKDSVAVVMTQSPVKDSINTVVVNSIASGAITGQNLSNGNGILVTNGTGATLKATTLRLDSTVVAKMMNQSPVKDSVAVLMTQSPVRDSLIKIAAAGTTNTLSSSSNALVSTVNSVVATLTPASGTIASGSTLGFNASGVLVRGLGNSPDSTTASNGLSLTGKDVRLGGTLSANTTIAQATNSLNLTSTASTGTSHFTVDGTTLNVDAVNNRVGIGTATPVVSLDTRGSIHVDDASTAATANQQGGYLTWNRANVGGVGSPNGGHLGFLNHQGTGSGGFVFTTTNDNTTFNERMRITGGGNVGIGTTAPNAALQFANVLSNRRVVLWEGGNNDHQFYGFGMNGGTLRYQVDNTGGVHAFFAATGTGASNELMRITGAGRVGIGTNAPTEALQVSGNVRFSGALMPNNNAGTSGQILESRGAGTPPVFVNKGFGESETFTPSVASGATSTVTLSILDASPFGARYKIYVSAVDGCGFSFFDEYIVTGSDASSAWRILPVIGVSAASTAATTFSTSGNTIAASRVKLGCGDGGTSASLDYTIVKASNTKNFTITNNGNVTRGYFIRVVSF